MQPGFIGQCLAEEMPWACLSRGSLKGLGEKHSWFLENLPGLPTWDSGEAGIMYEWECVCFFLFHTEPRWSFGVGGGKGGL